MRGYSKIYSRWDVYTIHLSRDMINSAELSKARLQAIITDCDSSEVLTSEDLYANKFSLYGLDNGESYNIASSLRSSNGFVILYLPRDLVDKHHHACMQVGGDSDIGIVIKARLENINDATLPNKETLAKKYCDKAKFSIK
jgi:hypothetical protein